MAKLFSQGLLEEDEAPNTEMMGLADMPLMSVLEFQEERLPMPPNELVDSMLAQVQGELVDSR